MEFKYVLVVHCFCLVFDSYEVEVVFLEESELLVFPYYAFHRSMMCPIKGVSVRIYSLLLL